MDYRYTGNADIIFELIGVDGPIIEINVDFSLVAKTKVDLKSFASIGSAFHKYGEDKGKVVEDKSSPKPIEDLPPVIRQVYKI